MREYSSPARYLPRPDADLTDDVFRRAETHPDQVVISANSGDAWAPVTAGEFADRVTGLAAGLIAAGIEPGDRVGLFSATRYEWMLVDYAIWSAGAITVPIYETSSAEQVQWILGDCAAVAVVAGTVAQAQLVSAVRAGLPALRDVWTIDTDELSTVERAADEEAEKNVARRRSALDVDSIATLVYTSGTTGRPRGCVITHGNLLAEVGNVCRADGIEEFVFNAETSTTLLFLPLAHVLARVVQLCSVHRGVLVGHTGDIREVGRRLAEFRPTLVLAVPRVLEKIYNSAQETASAKGRARLFALADRTAVDFSRSLDTGGPGLALRLRHGVFDRLVYQRLRAAMGGEVQYSVSGGAPLGERLGHFFRGIGVSVLEGYGLTETCAAISVNVPGGFRVGSVGRPVPGFSVRIADDGEVLIKGPGVFRGYWRDDEATRAAFDDEGWFHSGDLGELDEDGFLTITGRRKDLIVTAAGKNVAPAVLEDRLRAHRLVSQCLVVGDRRPYIGALVTIDAEAFDRWKLERGKPDGVTVADLRDDPDLRAEIQQAVDLANRAVSSAEAIKRFRVLGTDFTIEGGELTPTLKVRRNVVFDTLSHEVDALYQR